MLFKNSWICEFIFEYSGSPNFPEAKPAESTCQLLSESVIDEFKKYIV